MLSRATEIIGVADAGKVDRAVFVSVVPLQVLSSIVTGSSLDPAIRDRYKQRVSK